MTSYTMDMFVSVRQRTTFSLLHFPCSWCLKSSGKLTIDLGQEQTGVTIMVYDLFGKLCYSQDYTHSRAVDLQISAPRGQYLVLARTAEAVLSRKIVIE